MEILKVKDWKLKSIKQFKPLLIVQSSLIVKVQRISDGKLFDLDQCVYSRAVYIANELREFNAFIDEFMPDGIHVKLGCRVRDLPDFNKDCMPEINYMTNYAEVLIDSMMINVADAYKI